MSTTGASTDHNDSQSEISSFSADEVIETEAALYEHSENHELVSLNEALMNLGLSNKTTPISGNRMTEEYLRRLCQQRHMYEHALELNEVLYLQQQGFTAIENLDIFKNCVCLFLNNNCIKTLRGLNSLRHLKQLYVNYNNIENLDRDDLANCLDLEYVNLSNNKIANLKNLDILPKLKILLVSNNLITELESLAPLAGSLEALDFSGNPINTAVNDDDFFAFCRENFATLQQIYTSGVPMISRVSQFRRRLMLELPALVFLDKVPVTTEDREVAAAWMRGGTEEEIKVRKELYEAKRHAMDTVLNNFRKFQADGIDAHAGERRVKEERVMAAEDDGAKMNAKLADDIRRILSLN
jgi:hypothetical protein